MSGNASSSYALQPDHAHDGAHDLVIEQDPAVVRPCALLRVAGALDPATAPALDEALANLVDRGHQYVDLDLRDVTFCDSAGLKVMLNTHERLRQRDGTLTLHDPCRSLRTLLDIFDLTTALHIRPPPQPGSAAVGGPPGLSAVRAGS